MFIFLKEANNYALQLKLELNSWYQYNNTLSQQLLTLFYHSLSNKITKQIKIMEYNYDLNQNIENNAYNNEFLINNFLSLIMDLHGTKKLPAVVFCLDRDICEELVIKTTENLEAQELYTINNELTPELRREKEKLKKLAKKQAKELAREQAKAAKRKGKQDDDMMMDDDNFNTAPLVIDDEPSEDPRFTFVKGFQTVRDSNAITKDEYEYWLERMKKRTGWDNDHPLVRALFRGLGVHHAGLPRAYLDIVETLFQLNILM